MKKSKKAKARNWSVLKKTLLFMRVTLTLLLIGVFQVSAINSYSQLTRISMDFSDIRISEVLNEIENQTNFSVDIDQILIIEKIEISLRTKLIYHLSHEIDPWWFQNFELFIDSMALVKTLSNLEEEVSRSKDPTIKNHLKKHKDDKRFPPSWKSLEQTSFGALSKLYGNLKHTVKSKDMIAKSYGAVNHTYLPS